MSTPIKLDPPTGTRDFFPPDARKRDYIIQKWDEACQVYAYEPYDSSVIESTRLWTEKDPEMIKQQYAFETPDGEQVSLRPEMTPTLARLIMSQLKILRMPLKWYSKPVCYRYEQTQRGRKREFYQLNCDVWGSKDILVEADIFSMIVYMFKSFGLNSNQVTLKFSSRKLIDEFLTRELKLNLSEDEFLKTCSVMDHVDKLSMEDLLQKLNKDVPSIPESIGLDMIKKLSFRKGISQRLSPQESLKLFKEGLSSDEFKSSEAIKEIETLLELCGPNGFDILEWLDFDTGIIRGLSYYTGIVFEGFACFGDVKRAICGGGRYDEILSTYGSNENVPACGFGMGDVVIGEILGDFGLLPDFSMNPVDDIVIPFNEKYRHVAIKVTQVLREKGRRVEMYLKKVKKLTVALDYANKLGATRAINIFPDEWDKEKKVQIKLLREENAESKITFVTLDEL
ncbi:hypothetical protein C9374_006841 [Naegleria lovaniensis]|uniref:histidine--tRNA ligase n=1 Tax=Naegleria lovaniensis TaxID=51637 RepID=A0AA88KXK3_NAELO|nr:uncharacterized protein C9374_006841 [Naegleria lovaniensis]KAG2393310.1 hypothetical protein C9374_006841 [Naegleria lovaniensis]